MEAFQAKVISLLSDYGLTVALGCRSVSYGVGCGTQTCRQCNERATAGIGGRRQEGPRMPAALQWWRW